MALMWLSIAFLAGVVAGTAVNVPLPVLAALVIVFIALAYLRRHTRLALTSLSIAALCLGLARAPHASTTTSPSDLAFYNGRSVQLQGVVDQEPDIRDTGANYVVRVENLLLRGRSTSVSGRVQIHTSRSEMLEYGDSVTVTGRLFTPKNNAAVPYRDVLARQGIGSEMRFPRILDEGPAASGWLGWIMKLRQRLEAGIDAWLPEPEAALLIAIALGAKSASLGDLSPVLVATGLIHIIAISGIKVAMVAGTLSEMARRLRSRHLALLVSLFALWGYVLLTGSTVSGERSAAMWSLVFIAAYLGRGTIALVSLSAAAAVMVGLDPSLPWDPAFQLSTVGTAAIVAFSDSLLNVFRYLPSPVKESFCVTLAAQAGTLPIVVLSFHVLSLTGPVANALVLPLLPGLIALGFLLGGLSGLPILAGPLGSFAYVLLHAVIWIATSLAKVPGAIPVSGSGIVISVLYYATLAAVAFVLLRRVHWAPEGQWHGRGREILITSVAAASLLTVSATRAQGDARPHLSWLGEGSSFLLQSGGDTVLIDGSPHPQKLLSGLGAALPYSRRSIGLIVVTDPRAGNVAGLTAVLGHYRVGEVLDVGAEYPSTGYARWRSELRRLHIPAYQLRTGVQAKIGTVRLEALGPDGLYSRPQDCIGLLRITSPGRSVLLTGAAGSREQNETAFRPVHLHADELVTTGSVGVEHLFLQTVHPTAVFSDAPARESKKLKAGQDLLEPGVR